VDNLVGRAKSQIEESRYGNSRNEVAETHGVASVIRLLQRVGTTVEVSLRADDIDLLTVVDDLANERYVLETEDREVPLLDRFMTTKGEKRSLIKRTLAKDRSNKSTIHDIGLASFDHIELVLGRATYYDDMGSWHNVLSIV